MSNLIMRADAFADEAHRSVGQTRKYTGAPYIEHPREVAAILASLGFSDVVIAAGLLHDVLEDVPRITRQILTAEFGSEVTQLVGEVSSVSRPEDGNRAARKAIDLAHVAQASEDGQSLKLADIISNSRTVAVHDAVFARIYLPEKRDQVSVLTRGHPILQSMARQVIGEGLRRIGAA